MELYEQNLDVTELVGWVKRQRVMMFPALLYLFVRAAEEGEGRLLCPCYTVLDEKRAEVSGCLMPAGGILTIFTGNMFPRGTGSARAAKQSKIRLCRRNAFMCHVWPPGGCARNLPKTACSWLWENSLKTVAVFIFR